ncbi:MAG: RidA family protein [Rhodospirillales bacterium]|nr:RidA family protein [Rhodospirillales bacterium]
MAHQRFRRYNTKDFWKGQSLDNDLCMVVRAGNMVFVRGQTGFDLNGKLHGIGDPAAQAEVAMKCLKTLLEEAGSRLQDICKIVIYITDRAYRTPVYRVIGKRLKGVYPVCTGLIVQALAVPELVMEIDAYAVIPEERMKNLPKASNSVARIGRKRR